VNRTHRRSTSTAVLVYVIVLLVFQVFLLTVAVEAFLEDDEPLGWASAALSVFLAGGAVAFLRFLRP
jgi:hypothetical protein